MSAILRGLGCSTVHFSDANMNGIFNELAKIIANVKAWGQYFLNRNDYTTRRHNEKHSECDYQAKLLDVLRKMDVKGACMNFESATTESHKLHFAAFRN
jgi:hypothetical protein